MSNEKNQQQEADEQHKDAAVKPDENTLHKTDPQDNMQGINSTVMQAIKDAANNSSPSKEEADRKRDEHM